MRDQVIEILRRLSESLGRKLRVLDVGGGKNSWAKDFVTDIMDIDNIFCPNKKVWAGDINELEIWKTFKSKEFDFAICTHTLEDIRNPFLVTAQMSRVAKAGFVAVPNRFQEMFAMEDLRYRGYWHHRWIFLVENQFFVAIPKLIPASINFAVRPKIKLQVNKKFREYRGIRFNPGIILKRLGKSKKPFIVPKIVENSHFTKHGSHELSLLWVNDLNTKFANRDYADSGYFKELEKINQLEAQMPKFEDDDVEKALRELLSSYI